MAYTPRLKELRQNANIMAKDLATEMDLSYRNYQRYENGAVDIPCSKLIFLADYFNVSLDYLVGRSDNPKISR